MKVYFAVFFVVLSSFCIAETLSHEIDYGVDKELMQIINDVIMEEVDEIFSRENFEISEEKVDFRAEESSILNFAKKVTDLIKTAKKCWNELSGKNPND
uniref:Zodarin 2a n=1 Tax=Zodarion styliferum TaxID=1089303 RepID=A0A8D7ZV30_9ARAC|nr:Zodarin 2a precursor [Zodarion styliferum]